MISQEQELLAKETRLSNVRSLIIGIMQSMDVGELKNFIDKLSRNLGIKVSSDLYDKMMLNTDEVKEMVEYGIEVGGHGIWHVNLSILNKDRLIEEIEGSLNFVKTLYEGTYTFAYPFGIYNDFIIEVVKSSGFKAAVTTDPHPNNLPINAYTLGRIPPYRFNLKDMASFKYSLIRC